jgi:TonB-linked SusC/RagA family outer membrane protein
MNFMVNIKKTAQQVYKTFTFRHRILFLLCVILFQFSTPVRSEDISGRILDEKTNEPVIGATISYDKGKTGTVSDVDGRFTLPLPSLPATLAVSYVGYEQYLLRLQKGKSDYTVYLRENVKLLDEAVVIGYGTQRRRELTGAVTTIPKEILAQKAISLDAILTGSVAGLNVTAISGQPGSGSSIRIRGGNSINASNEPLYVIDGVIVYPRSTSTGADSEAAAVESSINPLASLNPADIESVSVLKDVSATAIFGSRGANGVIIVTTRKGERAKDIVRYTLTTGWSTPAKRLQLMNAPQWAQIQIDYRGNKGNLNAEYLNAIGKGYDWQDAVLQTGFTQTHDLSVSGGDERTRYSISGNFVNQQGIIIHSGFRRYNAHITLDRNLSNKLSVGASATFGKNTQNSLTTSKEVNYNSSPFGAGITNSLTYALFMPPTEPIYRDGGFNYQNPWESSHFSLLGHKANPVSDLASSVAESINNSLLANFYASYAIINGLVAKATLSTDQSDITQHFFAPSTSALGMNEGGVGSIGKKRYEIWQSDATIDYSRRFHEAHFVHLMGGYTYQQQDGNYLINRASHFINETLKHNNLGDGSVQTPTDNGVLEASSLHSVIARLNYSLRETVNLTVNFRADYSSRFAPGKRWGYFPSIGLSWNVDKAWNAGQDPAADNSPRMSTLKLRLSSGTVGNTEIGDFLWLQISKPHRYNGQTVYQMDNLGNPNLTWETTTEYNAGMDAGWWGDRLSLTADVYHKNTRNLLFEKAMPLGSPVEKQIVNIGNVNNKGFELSLNAVPANNKKWRWNLSANIARNINTVTGLGGEDEILSGSYSEKILKVGQAFGSFYGLVFDGIVQTGDDLSQLPTVNGIRPKPGDLKFADLHPDGNIDLNDRTVLGSLHPDFTYGLASSVACRGFDLFLSFAGAQGGKTVNSLRRNLECVTDGYNLSARLLDAWTPTNPSNEVPSITASNPLRYIDSRYVEDASFFRCKNITLGYTLHPGSAPTEIRIFASAQNPFTLTPYRGYDPEVANGTDIGAYPTARTFSLGVSVSIH